MSLLVPEMATLFHWIRRRFVGIIDGLGSILVSSVSASYIFHWMHSDWGMGGGGSGFWTWWRVQVALNYGSFRLPAMGRALPATCEAWLSSVLWIRLLPRAIAYVYCLQPTEPCFVYLHWFVESCLSGQLLFGILRLVTELQTGLPEYRSSIPDSSRDFFFFVLCGVQLDLANSGYWRVISLCITRRKR